MFPFLLLPFAVALGIAVHDTQSPAERAATDSAAVANANSPATIRFQNDALDNATVYAVPDHGMAVRLGEVFGGQTSKLVVPRDLLSGGGMVNIVAVPFARNFVVRSGPVPMSPGDVMNVRLTADERAVSVLPAR
jgi:hypothetical protein